MKKIYSEEEMAEILKLRPRINKFYRKEIDVKKTAKFHKRNIPAIGQSISEIKPTVETASKLPVLFEKFLFLTKTIIYQILLVSLPRSPQMQILLLFSTELAYLGLLITNYYRYKHLDSVVLFVAKLPLSIFMMLILILSAIFSISESIEKRRGARKASPPSVVLQVTGMVLILASVGVEYILLIYKLYLSVRAFLKKKKKRKGVTKGHKGKVRPLSTESGRIQGIEPERVDPKRNQVSQSSPISDVIEDDQRSLDLLK